MFLLSLFFLFVISAMTSTAGMAAFGLLMAPVSFFFAIRLISNKQFKMLPSQWTLLCLSFVSILSLLVNSKGDLIWSEGGSILRLFTAVFLVFPIGYFLKRVSLKQLRALLLVLILLSSLAHISGIIGLFTGYNPLRFGPAVDPTRAAGTFGMAIAYGYSVQFLFLIFLGLLTQSEKLRPYIPKNALIAATILTGSGLLLSLSRGAILGVLFAVPFLFYRSSPKIFRLSGALVLGLITILLIVMISVPKSNRLSYLSDSNMIRVSQYQTAWEAFKEKPIWGHGYRQFEPEVKRLKMTHDIPFKNFLGHAHNNYVEAQVSMGIPGFILFSLFVILGLREVLKIKHFLGPTLLVCWVAFIVSGLFQDTFYDMRNMFLFFMIYGVGNFLLLQEQRLDASSQSV